MESETRKWVKAKLDIGYTRAQIEDYMLRHGYTKLMIDRTFKDVDSDLAKRKGMSAKVLVLVMTFILLLGGIAFLYIAESRSSLVSNLVRNLIG